MPYIPHTRDEVRAMLDVVGVPDVESLFADIPQELRPKHFDLPSGKSERAVLESMERLSQKNAPQPLSFLGAGFYDHFIPSAVDAIASRGEFLTAYTPYQPEASQGTLQAIFEYQTMIARLLGMECANASVYDGGTAIFEAIKMAVRRTKRRRILVSESLNPIYRIMLGSYTANLDIEFVTVAHKNGRTDLAAMLAALDGATAAVLVQNPDFFGHIADYGELFAAARAVKAVSIISVYPVLQSLLKTPGEMGADVAVAEGQGLGLPLSFGGPYLGIMACSKDMIRQLPGRIVGRTTDQDGRTGYVLTLQAREQHIRRQKATSNICSNQSLCALRAAIHMSLLGNEGLERTAELCLERAHYAAERLSAIQGVEIYTPAPFGNEFAITLPISASEVIGRLMEREMAPGFPLGRYYQGLERQLLVACTEKHSEEQIDLFAELLAGVLKA